MWAVQDSEWMRVYLQKVKDLQNLTEALVIRTHRHAQSCMRCIQVSERLVDNPSLETKTADELSELLASLGALILHELELALGALQAHAKMHEGEGRLRVETLTQSLDPRRVATFLERTESDGLSDLAQLTVWLEPYHKTSTTWHHDDSRDQLSNSAVANTSSEALDKLKHEHESAKKARRYRILAKATTRWLRRCAW